MRKILAASVLVAAMAGLVSGPASAKTFDHLYHDGDVVRTFVPPASIPNGGIDPLYMFTNGVPDQFSVITYAPGDPPYHGGRWAVYSVTFVSDPYLITSTEALLAAEAAGDVTIVRTPSADVRCPVLP
jgi:hypothetical protein